MKEAEKLIERADRAHAGRLTEKECQQLAADLEVAIATGNKRLDSLGYDGLTGKGHPARAEALENGIEAVKAADREEEELRATLQLLEHHLDRCQNDILTANEREAPSLAQSAIKALPAAVERLRKAQEAAAEAQAAVDRHTALLTRARQAAKGCPGLSEKDFNALVSVTCAGAGLSEMGRRSRVELLRHNLVGGDDSAAA